MHYTIYKTTNCVNGKIYIGKHQTTDLDDMYLGSGKNLCRALKKHGVENFQKEILFVFDNEGDMNAKEAELVTEEFCLRDDTYNLGVGGQGGPHFKGKKHTMESRTKMGLPGRVFSVETRLKISTSNLGRVFSKETRDLISQKAMARYSNRIIEVKCEEKYVMTEDHKKKISESLRNSPKVNTEKSKTTIICPHCSKVGQELAMRRHHFKNCKSLRKGQDS